jgi:hypothetical protein
MGNGEWVMGNGAWGRQCVAVSPLGGVGFRPVEVANPKGGSLRCSTCRHGALGRQCVGRVPRLEASAVMGHWAWKESYLFTLIAHHRTCLIPNSQFPMPNAQFPIPNAQCPIPNAQFPIPNARLPT